MFAYRSSARLTTMNPIIEKHRCWPSRGDCKAHITKLTGLHAAALAFYVYKRPPWYKRLWRKVKGWWK
jgi:hypothetical protein